LSRKNLQGFFFKRFLGLAVAQGATRDIAVVLMVEYFSDRRIIGRQTISRLIAADLFPVDRARKLHL
jgi:hypothetical protein